jgi:hypothetical protein
VAHVLCQSANFLAGGSQKMRFREVAKGPIEAFEARLRELETRVGRPVIRTSPRPPQEGNLGPGGQWLLVRLDPKDPERLDRREQDVLGNALLAYDRQDFQEAQELLDELQHEHQLRMALKQSSSGPEVSELDQDR